MWISSLFLAIGIAIFAFSIPTPAPASALVVLGVSIGILTSFVIGDCIRALQRKRNGEKLCAGCRK